MRFFNKTIITHILTIRYLFYIILDRYKDECNTVVVKELGRLECGCKKDYFHRMQVLETKDTKNHLLNCYTIIAKDFNIDHEILNEAIKEL